MLQRLEEIREGGRACQESRNVRMGTRYVGKGSEWGRKKGKCESNQNPVHGPPPGCHLSCMNTMEADRSRINQRLRFSEYQVEICLQPGQSVICKRDLTLAARRAS